MEDLQRATLLQCIHQIKTHVENGRLDLAGSHLSQAAKCLLEASDMCSDEIVLWEQFGIHLISTGETESLSDLLPKLVNIHPWPADIHSHMLLNLHHLPDVDPKWIVGEHRRWAQIHAAQDKAASNHDNVPDPGRKLRIGYISPDFRMHPVGCFVWPLVNDHNSAEFEVFGYGNVAKPDDFTERFANTFHGYRNVFDLEDAALVDRIRKDKIDVLIDLAGHTNHNRLTALAHRPAPIQVSYLGYPGTTGMQQIDYRLTDKLVNLPESHEFYTEELVYVPTPFAAYHFTDLPPVASLPCQRNGYVTFGAFKNNCKINAKVIALWAEIMKANVNSRLILRFTSGHNPNVRTHYMRQFERLGIARDRIEIGGRLAFTNHLRQYDRVDIGLDTFPFNGHTTTCDALWMGVPMISLTGDSFASRLGLCLLKSVGLEFFATASEEEYVAKATALARNPDSLAKIRASMRDRIQSSDLYNSKRLAESVESAYRQMWSRWCASQGSAR